MKEKQAGVEDSRNFSSMDRSVLCFRRKVRWNKDSAHEDISGIKVRKKPREGHQER
jgi:hypothetical protein